MNNLTPIELTYIFDYGSMTQVRTFITRSHFDSLKEQTRPLDEDIKKLWTTVNEKSNTEAIKQVRDAVKKLELEIKRILPAYTFIVEDSEVGSALLSANEGEAAEAKIPYNNSATYKIKYKFLN